MFHLIRFFKFNTGCVYKNINNCKLKKHARSEKFTWGLFYTEPQQTSL